MRNKCGSLHICYLNIALYCAVQVHHLWQLRLGFLVWGEADHGRQVRNHHHYIFIIMDFREVCIMEPAQCAARYTPASLLIVRKAL